MSRFQLLTDAQWSLIEDLFPVRTGKKGRPFRDARQMLEGIIYRYRCGIVWRDVPAVFRPWQTIWTWHRRMSADGTWDLVLARLLAAADEAGIIGVRPLAWWGFETEDPAEVMPGVSLPVLGWAIA